MEFLILFENVLFPRWFQVQFERGTLKLCLGVKKITKSALGTVAIKAHILEHTHGINTFGSAEEDNIWDW